MNKSILCVAGKQFKRDRVGHTRTHQLAGGRVVPAGLASADAIHCASRSLKKAASPPHINSVPPIRKASWPPQSPPQASSRLRWKKNDRIIEWWCQQNHSCFQISCTRHCHRSPCEMSEGGFDLISQFKRVFGIANRPVANPIEPQPKPLPPGANSVVCSRGVSGWC